MRNKSLTGILILYFPCFPRGLFLSPSLTVIRLFDFRRFYSFLFLLLLLLLIVDWCNAYKYGYEKAFLFSLFTIILESKFVLLCTFIKCNLLICLMKIRFITSADTLFTPKNTIVDYYQLTKSLLLWNKFRRLCALSF